MKESKHTSPGECSARPTPGPWMTHGQFVITGNPDGPIDARNGEDARLIAAAPGMLAVIEQGIEAVDAHARVLPPGYALPKCLAEWAEWAEDVIKRAKGE